MKHSEGAIGAHGLLGWTRTAFGYAAVLLGDSCCKLDGPAEPNAFRLNKKAHATHLEQITLFSLQMHATVLVM